MNRKPWVLQAVVALFLAVLPMGGGAEIGQEALAETELTVIATVFPAYDFARQILGEQGQVRLLLPPGSESHSYEPTPQDIIAIQQADLFLYVGGESEHWVMEMLVSMGEAAPVSLAMMDCATTLAEELSASMIEDSPHPQEHREAELDEHVWTSPKNAKTIVQAYSDMMIQLAPHHQQVYGRNAETYLELLQQLDDAMTRTVETGMRRKIIVGDRFPFRYLAHDYGLSYDAAFPGCSEDSEPSVRTIASLIQEIRREDIPVVFYIEFSNQKTAEILTGETGAKALLLHSCHNVSQQELEAGATYLSLMEGNVAALREALS